MGRHDVKLDMTLSKHDNTFHGIQFYIYRLCQDILMSLDLDCGRRLKGNFATYIPLH